MFSTLGNVRFVRPSQHAWTLAHFVFGTPRMLRRFAPLGPLFLLAACSYSTPSELHISVYAPGPAERPFAVGSKIYFDLGTNSRCVYGLARRPTSIGLAPQGGNIDPQCGSVPSTVLLDARCDDDACVVEPTRSSEGPYSLTIRHPGTFTLHVRGREQGSTLEASTTMTAADPSGMTVDVFPFMDSSDPELRQTSIAGAAVGTGARVIVAALPRDASGQGLRGDVTFDGVPLVETTVNHDGKDVAYVDGRTSSAGVFTVRATAGAASGSLTLHVVEIPDGPRELHALAHGIWAAEASRTISITTHGGSGVPAFLLMGRLGDGTLAVASDAVTGDGNYVGDLSGANNSSVVMLVPVYPGTETLYARQRPLATVTVTETPASDAGSGEGGAGAGGDAGR